jgi:hypothetical protein
MAECKSLTAPDEESRGSDSDSDSNANVLHPVKLGLALQHLVMGDDSRSSHGMRDTNLRFRKLSYQQKVIYPAVVWSSRIFSWVSNLIFFFARVSALSRP